MPGGAFARTNSTSVSSGRWLRRRAGGRGGRGGAAAGIEVSAAPRVLSTSRSSAGGLRESFGENECWDASGPLRENNTMQPHKYILYRSSK